MRGWNATFVIVLAAMFLAAPGARAANCPQAEISSAATELQDTRNALMSMTAPKEPTISRDMQTAITEMKARLAKFIFAYMRCQPENADIDGIEVDLSRLGWARSPEPGRVYRNDELPPLANAPGWRLTFDIRSLGQSLIGISSTFGIPCGSDTMLMIFQHSDDGWTEIMRVANPPYRNVFHALEAFDYAISPPDDGGNWFLVEKHLPTTCMSTMTEIVYSVMRPTPRPLAPRVLFSGIDDMSLATEDFGRLTVGADFFEVRFHNTVAADVVEIVRRFSVTGQTVTPVKNPPPQ